MNQQLTGKEERSRRARRRFIMLLLTVPLAGSVAGAILTRASEELMPWLLTRKRRKKQGPQNDKEYFSGSPRHHWAMIIDTTRCLACGACIEACSIENSSFLGVRIPFGSRTRIVFTEYGGKRKPFHLICQHCEPAPCVEVCPTGASVKRKDGIVVIDYRLCIGCKYCMSACPYGARYVNGELNAVDKCTFCAHRIDRGGIPACVEACPVGARILVDTSSETSPAAMLIREGKAVKLRAVQGIEPNVYYVF